MPALRVHQLVALRSRDRRPPTLRLPGRRAPCCGRPAPPSRPAPPGVFGGVGIAEQHAGERAAIEVAQVDRAAGGRQIGAVFGEHRDHRGAIGRGGEHRRGESARRFARVQVGADGRSAPRPQPTSPDAAANISAVVPLPVVAFDVGARREQRLHHGGVALLGRQQQRRVAADARRRLAGWRRRAAASRPAPCRCSSPPSAARSCRRLAGR